MTPQSLNTAAAESLLAFWRDAGVDACFEDAPVDRTRVELPAPRQAVLKATASVAAPPHAADCADDARRLAAQAATLPELMAAAAAFDGCGLKMQGARRAVVGDGPADAAVLVVGAAPCEAEDQTGDIFAGPAGRLFDVMLAEAGLSGRVYRMNSVFWRPPGDRVASPEEQAACAPFLDRALELLRPRAALLLGAAPARAVLNATDPLPKLQGQWRDWRPPQAGGVSVSALITLNPGFLLRMPIAKRAAWADLLALAARLDAPTGSEV